MMRPCAAAKVLACTAVLAIACARAPDPWGTGSESSTSGGASTTSTSTTTAADGSSESTGSSTSGAATLAGSSSGDDDTSSSSTGGVDPGPDVDLSDPQLYTFEFTAADADGAAKLALGTQVALLDTRAQPRGRLVVHLHGAGAPTYCGAPAHGELLAAMGFHVVMPCYVSDYGVGNCGDDIGGCRLEAFEGVDHHGFVEISPPDSIETRVVRALQRLHVQHPGGDWQYYLDGAALRWDHIVISGLSHGASTSGLVGKHRFVDRVVMLSGPLDTNQAWLVAPALTPIDRYFGFTHSGDEQHPGHLQAFESLGMLGAPVVVDAAAPPYDESHRLVTSALTSDGHGSTQAGSSSPQDAEGQWLFAPVWQQLYAGGS